MNPRRTFSPDRRWWLALTGCAVVSIVRQVTWAIGRSPETLMRRAPADDGFIYLVLAEHAPRPEFNEGIATTGFHPLYWLILSPIARVWDGMAGVRAMLLLCVALHVVSGVILFVALRHRHAPGIAFAASGLWLLLPGIRTIIVMGVETAVLSCCLALLLLVVLQSPEPTRRSAIHVGLVVGLTYLARTDSAFVTLPLVAAWTWSGRARLREQARLIATSGVAAFVVALPWMAYALSQGGLFASDAFRAERLGSSPSLFLATEKRALAELLLLNGAGRVREILGGGITNAALLIGFGLAGWVLLRNRDRIGLAALGGPILVFLAYGWLEGYMRDWYEVYPLFAICAVLVPLVAERLPARSAPAVLVAALAVAVLIPNHTLNPQEGDKYLAAPIASRLLPADARVGAFNSGVFQYFMRQDVVNLDGVVNPEVLGPKQDGRLCDYLADHDINFIVDTTVYLEENQRLDSRLHFTRVIELTPLYAPSNERVDQPQQLATVDLKRCRGPR